MTRMLKAKPVSGSEARLQTIDQLAARYQLSVRMIAYLLADDIFPAYKIGGALRFDPVECDIAMRSFRKRCVYDDIIDQELAKHRDNSGSSDNCSDQDHSGYAELSQRTPSNSDETPVNTGRNRRRKHPSRKSSKSLSVGQLSDWDWSPATAPAMQYLPYSRGFLHPLPEKQETVRDGQLYSPVTPETSITRGILSPFFRPFS